MSAIFWFVCIRIEDAMNFGLFAYSTNSFDIQEPKTYEKVMAFDQAEKWVEIMQ